MTEPPPMWEALRPGGANIWRTLGYHGAFENERMVIEWLKPKENNLVARLGKLSAPAEIADELYLSVLTRQPEKEEVSEVENFLKKNESNREEALRELTWALLASAEFRLNH